MLSLNKYLHYEMMSKIPNQFFVQQRERVESV